MVDQTENVFHQHLDVCKQCREQSYNLCPEGSIKLQLAAGEAVAELEKNNPLAQALRPKPPVKE
jgi:hypothetical protein